MKIAVYGIALNEAKFVEAFCRSAADADVVIIADTGSTDETAFLAEFHGAEVHRITISPWRFDDARNASLALLPADIDVCICLDLDEVLEPGWREEIERLWTEGVTRLRYMFDWGSGLQFHSDKIHARRGYRWKHPCHELLYPDRIEEKWASTDRLLITHHPDPEKSRSQYLPLLEVGAVEDPQCPRNSFYYARELSYVGRWPEAIAACHRYLALPGAVWNIERAYAMRIIADGHAAAGYLTEAIAWGRRATAEAPETREAWCSVAKHAYALGRWPECYGAALTALAITDQPKFYTNDLAAQTFEPHDWAAIAAWNLGMKDEAVEHGHAALRFDPGNEHLQQNLARMGAA